jgi:hypothetical protein
MREDHQAGKMGPGGTVVAVAVQVFDSAGEIIRPDDIAN